MVQSTEVVFVQNKWERYIGVADFLDFSNFKHREYFV